MRMRRYIEDQKRFCFLGTEMINLGENTYQGGFPYFRNSSWVFRAETLTVLCSSNPSEVPPPPPAAGLHGAAEQRAGPHGADIWWQTIAPA